MAEIIYRPAEMADTQRVRDLIGELAAFEKLEHQFTGSTYDLAEALFSDPPAAQCLVAEETGHGVVGYAIFFETFSTFRMKRGLWLEDLYVTPSRRRMGIGKRLLEIVARIAVKHGCARFEWSVLDWNKNAQSLYRSIGADIMPDWRIYRLEGGALRKFGSE